MQILPMAKCICPSCFEEINLGDCSIVSGVTTGKVLKKASKWSLGRVFIEPLEGPLYTQELAHRQCYNCQYSLPYNIENVRSITLTVVGDVYSGKSSYIASLIRQLRYEWVNNFSAYFQLHCLTPDIERDFTSRYLTPLYGKNIALPQTQQAERINPQNPQPLVNRPLIYEIKFRPSPHHPAISFNLMIYDTSGEDFRQIERLVQFARFAMNSSAFIFVVDPFAMDSVYRELPPNLKAMIPPYAQPDKRRPVSDVLNGVVNSFQGWHHRQPDRAQFADVPCAVIVSKADIFTKAINPPYTSNYDGFAQSYRPRYGPGVDLDDIEEINREVISLLKYYGQESLLSTTSRLKNVKFFATSATGEPPDSPDHFPSVNPWRCLDPMLWIFYQLGTIKDLNNP